MMFNHWTGGAYARVQRALSCDQKFALVLSSFIYVCEWAWILVPEVFCPKCLEDGDDSEIGAHFCHTGDPRNYVAKVRSANIHLRRDYIFVCCVMTLIVFPVASDSLFRAGVASLGLPPGKYSGRANYVVQNECARRHKHSSGRDGV